MKRDTIEKPSLDVLLNQDLHDLINATAFRFYAVYAKRSQHSAMISQEDIAAQGFFGVMTAYQSFDPSIGYDDNLIPWFRSHAYPYVKNAMLTYCRKFSHSLSISEKAAREDWGDICSIGVVHIDHEHNRGSDQQQGSFDIPTGSGMDAAGLDIDDYFFAGFSQLERNLVKDHLLDGYSLQEVSKRHQISKSRASEIIRGLKGRMEERAKDYVKDD
jgi:RNA polymerase sigma factor (sigma-70 family)